MIWAVVLAAGESKRMGRPKLLLPYGKTTIIETVIDRVTASRVDQTLVALGSRWRTLKKQIREYAISTAVNPGYQTGMLSSVQRGIAALPDKCRAAVVVLGDQPDVLPEVINLLIDAYHRGKKGIVVPVYRRKRGHPILIDLKYRREIKTLRPQIGLRELMQRHPQDILEVRVPDSGVLHDIDVPGDYRIALKTEGKR